MRLVQAMIFSLSLVCLAAYAQEHPGPLGLKWGKSPADARSILNGKVEFVSESPAAEEAYHTIDQHYRGAFAGLPTRDIYLKFHQGEFFYLMVTLTSSEAGSATKVWEDVVSKMTAAYGKPQRINPPPMLASPNAIQDNLPLSPQERQVMPLLLNEASGSEPIKTYHLHDLNVRSGLWDPFAAWRFDNGVVVQSFIYQDPKAEPGKQTLMPLWIFAHEHRLAAWRKTKGESYLIEPRDF